MSKTKKKVNDKNLMEEMDAFQLSRWLALFEAVNIIANEAKTNRKNINKVHMKKPALEEYVDRTSILIYRELTGKEYR